jgi:hypothetical protein
VDILANMAESDSEDDGAGTAEADMRDMSGDARTYEQARHMYPRPYAECSLSAYRNVMRDEDASRESLASLTIDREDIRFPEWGQILERVIKPGECVAAFYPHRLPDRALWLGIRVAVMITQAPNHVVAVWRHSDDRSLRVYDNDSHARTQGTYTLLGVGVRWRGRAVAVMQEGSPLHHIALEHIPPRRMVHTAPGEQPQAVTDSEDSWEDESHSAHRARNQPPSSADGIEDGGWPVYDNPVATRATPHSLDSDSEG